MSVTGVGTTSNDTSTSGSSALGGNQQVDKQEFLMLLVAQLRNQDPMNPMQDRDFIAQLAQFNSLEQMQMLNRTVAATSEMTVLGQLANYVGKQVSAMGPDGEAIEGIVSAVTVVDGSAILTVGDEQVDLRSVYQISEPPPAAEQPVDTPDGAGDTPAETPAEPADDATAGEPAAT